VDEKAWLVAFLKTRRATLAHASDPETRAVWAESVGRVDIFKLLADSGQWELRGPIAIKSKDYEAMIP
jgi:chitosanase